VLAAEINVSMPPPVLVNAAASQVKSSNTYPEELPSKLSRRTAYTTGSPLRTFTEYWMKYCFILHYYGPHFFPAKSGGRVAGVKNSFLSSSTVTKRTCSRRT
jgi:hypothetical protein